MANESKETTSTAMEMREMRALIGRIFGVLRDRQDKSDQAILELKETVESLKNQQKGKEEFEPEKPSVNASGYGNSSTLQGRGKTLTTSKVVVDVPTVDRVTTEQEEITMRISMDAVVEYSEPYKGFSRVTGYHGKRPVNILIGLGGSTHNFIDESFADKLGCDTFPIKPRSVSSAFGNMVTSRACYNFQLLLQGALFILDLYLLPFSSNCEMVLGGEWLATIGGQFTMDSKGMEFSYQGKKHFLPFKKSAERNKC
ncbi:uncharacterized protein LOC107793624 isoform X1 [Nicotiana tabacum]|uniref:Uncharacterized protein LOC107793624 isoform X1 n=3 Tax=Nicotiana TaxID=4085 RepID=A0AC58UQT1_TOBAC|nr:PREDICTED: uncharacterized protein LOC104226986 [Nicotiana sylvestris]XP_016471500.1 PREDICTED: uncharacterized protein LOC107793624 isoform X1 [Nicotiana tabacum]